MCVILTTLIFGSFMSSTAECLLTKKNGEAELEEEEDILAKAERQP